MPPKRKGASKSDGNKKAMKQSKVDESDPASANTSKLSLSAFPANVIELIFSHLSVDELVITATTLSKSLRSITLKSNNIWRHSYSLTFHTSLSLMDASAKWKKIAIMRYRKQIQKMPNFIQLLAASFNAKLSTVSSLEGKLELSEHLTRAYKTYKWEKGFETLFADFKDLKYRIATLTNGDMVETVKTLFDKVMLIDYESSDFDYDQFEQSIGSSFAIWTETGALSGIFGYSQVFSQDNDVHPANENIITMTYDGAPLFDHTSVEEEAFHSMKAAVLGSKKSEVSNEVLAAFLMIAGSSAESYDRTPSPFIHYSLSTPFEAIINLIQALPADGDNEPSGDATLDKKVTKLPDWFKFFFPHPVQLSNVVPKEKEVKEHYLGYSGRYVRGDKIKAAKVTKVSLTGKKQHLKDEVRLARFYLGVENRLAAWLASTNQANDKILSQFAQPGVVVPVKSVKFYDEFNCDSNDVSPNGYEFSQFVIHSPITGKSSTFTYRLGGHDSEYEEEGNYFEITFDDCSFGLHLGKDGARGEEAGEEQGEDGESGEAGEDGGGVDDAKARLPIIFYKFKKDVFGIAKIPLSLEVCLDFLCVIGHTATMWRGFGTTESAKAGKQSLQKGKKGAKSKTIPENKPSAYFASKRNQLMREYVIQTQAAWKKSESVTTKQANNFKSDLELQEESTNKFEADQAKMKQAEKDKKDKRKKDVASSKALISEIFPVQQQGGMMAMISRNYQPYINVQDGVLMCNKLYHADLSSWPPKVFKTDFKPMEKVTVSLDGRKLVGNETRSEGLGYACVGHLYSKSPNPNSNSNSNSGQAPFTFLCDIYGAEVGPDQNNNNNNNNVVKNEYNTFISSLRGEHTVQTGFPQNSPLPFVGFVDDKLLIGGSEDVHHQVYTYHFERPDLQQGETRMFEEVKIPLQHFGCVLQLPSTDAPKSKLGPPTLAVCSNGTLSAYSRDKNSFYRLALVDEKGKEVLMIPGTPHMQGAPDYSSLVASVVDGDSRHTFYVQENVVYEILWDPSKENTLKRVAIPPTDTQYQIRTIMSAGSLLVLASSQVFAFYELACIVYQPKTKTHIPVPAVKFGIWNWSGFQGTTEHFVWSEPLQSLIAITGTGDVDMDEQQAQAQTVNIDPFSNTPMPPTPYRFHALKKGDLLA